MRTFAIFFVVAAFAAVTGAIRVGAQDPGDPVESAGEDVAPDPSLAPLPKPDLDAIVSAGESAGDAPPRDVQDVALSAKPTYPKLGTELSALAESAAAGVPTPLPPGLVGDPQDSRVAVSVRHESNVDTFNAALGKLPGVLIANMAEGVTEAYVAATALVAVSEIDGVLAVDPIIPPQATVTSEGAAVHNSPNWNAYGFTGDGIKVGVIDVGFIGYSSLIGTELPAPAGVRCYTGVGAFTADIDDCETTTEHGTAVTEALVDIAPDVEVYIANPFSALDLNNTVSWLLAQGVTVINHSVGWRWSGPGDGTTPLPSTPLHAVNSAVAGGAIWVNAAGNDAQATWTGGFADVDNDGILSMGACNELNGVFLQAGFVYQFFLRWEDDWTAADRDFDLLLLSDPSTLVALSANAQQGQPGQTPFEVIVYVPPTTGTYYLAIGHFSGEQPAWFDIGGWGGHQLSCRVLSHSIANPAESASTGMLAVGAANHANLNAVESFSSRGPTRDGRVKPDITGVDAGDSAIWGPWFGTSQASPHVAGLAAILREGLPGLTPAQLVTQLKAWAVPKGTPSPNNDWGAGLAFLPTILGRASLGLPLPAAIEDVAMPALTAATVDENSLVQGGDDTTEITLSLVGAAGLGCGSGLTQQVTDGLTQFTDCVVDTAGTFALRVTPDCFCVISTYGGFVVAPPPSLARHQFSAAALGSEAGFFGRNAASDLWYRETVAGVFGAWTLVPTGSTVAGTPEAIQRPDGDLFVFFRGSGGDLSYSVREDGSSTWNTFSLGGTIFGDPVVAVDGTGDVVVVAVGGGGSLWQRRLPAGSLTFDPWAPVDGAFPSANMALAAHGGNLALFGLDANNGAWTRTWDGAANSWGSWTYLNGYITSNRLSAVSHGGKLYFFVLGGGGGIYYRSLTGASWSGWAAIDGILEGTVAVTSATGDLLAGGVNIAGLSWARTSVDGSAWSSWEYLGGIVATTPEVVAAGPGAYYFALSDVGTPWYRTWDGATWSDWSSLGGTLALD